MATSDCKNILNLIPLYLDNMLSEEENDVVRQHLTLCEDCKKEFEFIKSLSKTTKKLPEIDVPVDFHKKLMTKVCARKTKHYLKLKRISTLSAAAAIIVLSVVAVSNFDVLPNTSTTDQYAVPKADNEDSPITLTAPENNKKSVLTEKAHSATVNENAEIIADSDNKNENQSEQNDIDVPVTLSLDEESKFKTATIILTDENKEAVLSVLSDLKKDETGYIVDDIDSILKQLSKLSVEVLSVLNTENAQNYIILK